jgi:diketogulonate reductase-like aldo/keto reductase
VVSLNPRAAGHSLLTFRNPGKVKNIGVSNFSIKNLNILLEKANVVPAINQVYMLLW